MSEEEITVAVLWSSSPHTAHGSLNYENKWALLTLNIQLYEHFAGAK